MDSLGELQAGKTPLKTPVLACYSVSLTLSDRQHVRICLFYLSIGLLVINIPIQKRQYYAGVDQSCGKEGLQIREIEPIIIFII